MSAYGAFAVPDASAVAAVRRAVQRHAEALGFSAARAGQAALIATELGTNLAKHARHGEMLIGGDADTLEVIALDRGPGISDVARSLRDGYSTSGTAGEGLGAVSRQSDLLEIYTAPAGTAILARLSRDGGGAPPSSPTRLEFGGLSVNAPGELVCGDAWDTRLRPARLVVMVADGLGHGLPAHDAAERAREVFADAHEQSPREIVEAIHAGLRHTRGAAVSVFAADLERGVARFCGLGNVAAAIAVAGSRRSLVSMPGTAGVRRPRVQEFQYPFPPDAMLVMHSDGVGAQWDVAAYPGLGLKPPSLIAGVLFRDFARRRDDATAVVVKERTRA